MNYEECEMIIFLFPMLGYDLMINICQFQIWIVVQYAKKI